MRAWGLGHAVLIIWIAASCGPPSGPAPDPATPPSADTSVPPPTWPAWGPVPWPSGDDALARALVQAELDRDPQAEAIDRAEHDDDPRWRARAAWTLARIGGPTARDRISGWLADGRIGLDASTLGAVGLLDAPGADLEPRPEAWATLEQRLWTRYAVTEDPAEADALLLAVARVGGARSSAWLAADLAVLPAADQEPRFVHAMEALAILCARGYPLPTEGLRAVAQAMGGPTVAPRRAAAQTLGRCAAVSAEQLAGPERSGLVERLVPMAAGDDPSSMRHAWRALEGLGELPSVTPPWILGASSPDWMAEVAAVRALAAHADGRKLIGRRLAAVELARFAGPRLHVLRELLERLRPFAAHEPGLDAPLAALAAALTTARDTATDDPSRRKALVYLGCEVALLQAMRTGNLDGVSGCAQGEPAMAPEHGEVLAIEALISMGPAVAREQRVAALLQKARDDRPRVLAPAVGALAGIDDPQVNEVLREALAHADMGVVASASGAVGARASDERRRDPAAVPVLLAVVRRFDNDHAVETRIAAIDALGRLARSTAPAEDGTPPQLPWLETDIVGLARDPATAVRSAARRALRGRDELLAAFDRGRPQRVPDGFAPAVHAAVDRWAGTTEGLRLHTDAGVITIDLSGAPAPIARASFVALAEAGYFDGLTFHRVVPGFVVQGGDPRGDGYGGPGHVMPCEWSTLRYERGTVGIALAGKDTGGSQLFIAHDRPPHLDARYTIIGRVVQGMEAVDNLWPYDRIERVERLEQRPTSGGSEP